MEIPRNETDFNRNFSENLRYLRENLLITQQQVADVLGCDRSSYTYLETGRTSATIYKAFVLSHLFEQPLDVLITHHFSEGRKVFPMPRLSLPEQPKDYRITVTILKVLSEDELKEVAAFALSLFKRGKDINLHNQR